MIKWSLCREAFTAFSADIGAVERVLSCAACVSAWTSRSSFSSVFLDVLKDLDINNLSYADVLLAIAKTLISRIEQAGLTIDRVHVHKLEEWFAERIEKHEKTKDYAAEIKAGVEAKQGIPFLGKLFAQLTTSFKTGSTYKEAR